MEHKQFTSDDLSYSPYSHEGFQTDRFTKTTNNLNIPATILESCSEELSGELPKMEVPDVMVESYDSDENKENISNNQQDINNKPLHSSENLAIDNSYIKQCEKKLLESSYNDEEKNFEMDNKGLVNRHFLEVQSSSAHPNDTISTPPSMLRKEISMLRKEMAEADEFHDFEIKVLQEERSLDCVDSEKYLELFEKYSALVDLYTNLKTELDEYRKSQETVRNELQSKTADYLESLCSQIETSDNSLNISNSFVSFGGGVKNSTMMEEASEVEATIVHEGTVLANDPLSITADNGTGTFKTPLQTPLRSAKKLFPEESSTGKTVAEKKDSTAKRDLTFESDYDIHLLNLETAFYDKVKEVEDLEQRLFKVEDMSIVLHSEFERISLLQKQSVNLKEELSAKTEQLNDLMQRLFTETISLNPSLRDSLIDLPGPKLLAVFLETIMENCKKIKNNDQLTTAENLRNQVPSQEINPSELEALRTTCEDLKAKLAEANDTISTREEEIRILESHSENVMQTRDKLASANERLLELVSEMKSIEAERIATENKCIHLEKVEEILSLRLEETQAQLELAQEKNSQIENENTFLKDSQDSLTVQIMETEAILKSQEAEIIAVKEKLMSAESCVQALQSQLKSVEDEKVRLQKVCEQLQEKNESPQGETSAKKIENNPDLEKVQSENNFLKQEISESEKRLSELKTELESARKREVEELMREVEQMRKENSGFSKSLENVERGQKLLDELLTDFGSDGDLPCARITKLIQKVPLEDSFEARETKIMSGIIETITKTCKNVQNELIKSFEGKQSEWDDQRNLDLNAIKRLEEDIKLLREKSDEGEARMKEIMSEKEDLMKVHEDLKKQIAEAERMVSSCNTDMKCFKSQEEDLKKAKDELSEAEEVIARLNDQLQEMKAEKMVAEEKCKDLENVWETLTHKFEENQNELEAAQEEKCQIENENMRLKECQDLLKGQIMETEAKLKLRETELIQVKENLMKAESSLQELQTQLKSVEEEKVQLQKVCEEVKENLVSTESSVQQLQSQLKLVEGEKVELHKVCEQVKENLMSAESSVQGLQSHVKLVEDEKAELQKVCEEVKENLTSAESSVQELQCQLKSVEDEKIELQKVYEEVKENLTAAESSVQELQCQLKSVEDEKVELQKVCEEVKENLTSAESSVQELQCQLKSVQDEKIELQKVCEDVKEKLMSAESSVQELQTQLKSVEDEKVELQKVYEEVKENLTAAESSVQDLQCQLKVMEDEKVELQKVCEEVKEKLTSAESSVQELQSHVKSVEDEKVELQKVCEEVKEKLMSAESSVQELQSQVKSVEDEKVELQKVCEELEEKNESLQNEIAAARTPEDNPAFEKIQTENEYLKREILESGNRLDELKMELENARVREVEELKREVEEVKKEKLGCSKSLENVERSQKFLDELLSEPGNDGDLPCERIAKLIEKACALKESLDPRETKIVCGFVETITKTCKNVQNELIRTLEDKQSEWEDQRNLDLNLIKRLEDDIKLLRKKSDEGEARMKEIILEKEDLMKLHEDLQNQMMEAERMVSNCNEEIKSFKSQEEVLKKAKDDLSEAEEVIARLNDQLLGVKADKTAAEDKCRDLKTVWETLSLKLSESQTKLASTEEEKSQIENEYVRLKESQDSLKVQMMETEAVLKSQESEILAVKEKLVSAESSVHELQSQLKLVEDEKVKLQKVCEQLRESNESLRDEISAAKKVENNPAFVKVQSENDYLKQEILESEKRLSELKLELENARLRDIEELVLEMEQVKKKNLGISKSLENVERGQKLLAELLTDLGRDGDLPCARITNLMQKVSLGDSFDARETKIMSGIIETITKTCKNVENELIKSFEGKQSEWEDKRNLDLRVIKSLENDIKLLREKSEEEEARMKEIVLEKEDLMKMHEDLKKQMMEAERMVVSCNEEMKSLKSQEEVLKKAKDDLSEAEEVIARLSDQLLTAKAQKCEAEQRREAEDGAMRTQMDGLKAENRSLKLGNESLRDRVKQLTKIIEETAGGDVKEELSNTSGSLVNGMNLRSKSAKRTDRYARRLDKLEEINHNLTELLIRILTATEYPELEKLNLSSVRDFPKTMKKVLDHLNGFLSKVKELKEENSQLDEECETYSNIIKDLKKEAVAVWKSNTEKTEALEAEIARLNEEKRSLENEKEDLLAKLSRLNEECQKLQSAPQTEGHHTCACGNDSKKVNELKRIILVKEQKLLELQDVEAQSSTLKSQLDYLKTALEREKKKAAEEKEKNKKLQNQLKEATKSEKKSEENQVLEELRMRGSISGGVVQEFGDKEKMRKLSKDIAILKELCRARYAEIKRLEAVNAALRSAAPRHPATPKNSNQMDSPIRTRGYNTRSKYQARDVWKTEIIGKENGGV